MRVALSIGLLGMSVLVCCGNSSEEGQSENSNGGSVGIAGRPSNGGSGSELSAAGGATGTLVCGAVEGQLFGPDYPFNQPIDGHPLDAESEEIIGFLSTNHTASSRFRIDGPSEEVDSLYGLTILTADSTTELSSFVATSDFYEPDCDFAPMPVPENGAVEGEAGYACEGDGDCHLLVISREECRLYEMWRANIADGVFYGGCLAIWDLEGAYTETLRGDCCTSADAAGLPIAAHTFTADEIATGEIRHAIRFVLPNHLMRERIYVRPATHSTSTTSGPPEAPPYGARLRLRTDFDESRLNRAAQVVARALKTYGMILADGGNITFTAANDRFTQAKWAEVGLGANDLIALKWTDFEVVELGERFSWDDSCNCERMPLLH